MSDPRNVRVGKLLSLALGRDETALGLELDARGWADVDAVVRGLRAAGLDVAHEELEEIVAEVGGNAFAISADGAYIRGSDGSTALDAALAPAAPPEVLLHGTVARFTRVIERDGLLRGPRTHVHLAEDEATARAVASRRSGPKALVVVRARAMHDEGHVFLRGGDGVWLTDHVPPRFLEIRAFAAATPEG